MYEKNHEIDKHNEWTNRNIERLFIFCLLDRAMPYESVCKIFDSLEKITLTSFREIKSITQENLRIHLSYFGHRFPTQTSRYIKYDIDKFTAKELYNMNREELVRNIKGFGYKLASMFHNRLHNSQYAIIDIHINNYLKSKGCKATSYLEKEQFFQKLAMDMNITPEELDWQIWNERRKKRKIVSE